MSTYLDKYYTDKKYINTNEYIKNNLENTPLLKDITNIVMNYLNNTVPLCTMCNGKANKNVIVQYCYPEYKNNVYTKTKIDICITCLLLQIPYFLDYPNIYSQYEITKYSNTFKKIYNKNNKIFLKFFRYIFDNINFGYIHLDEIDIRGLYASFTHGLKNNLSKYIFLFDDKDYPIYKSPFSL